MEEAKKMHPREYIKIRGANEHNLKNINVDIPRNELVVLTGMSGSGKSSLAFDTIYAEGQRRYLYSMMRLLRWFPMKRKRVGFGAVYRKNCLHPPCPALPNAGWRKSRKRHRSCFVISVKQ